MIRKDRSAVATIQVGQCLSIGGPMAETELFFIPEYTMQYSSKQNLNEDLLRTFTVRSSQFNNLGYFSLILVIFEIL